MKQFKKKVDRLLEENWAPFIGCEPSAVTDHLRAISDNKDAVTAETQTGKNEKPSLPPLPDKTDDEEVVDEPQPVIVADKETGVDKAKHLDD